MEIYGINQVKIGTNEKIHFVQIWHVRKNMLYLNGCSRKKGGIIIEFESKNALLLKVLILVPVAILAMTLCNSNTLYARKWHGYERKN